MFGIKTPARKRNKDEAEKPFWISFSDLMTALMVLFLVAMAVALMAVTQGLETIKQNERQRDSGVQSCMEDMTKVAMLHSATVKGHSIEFGSLVQYSSDSHKLPASSEEYVRKFVPHVLQLTRTGECQKWLKKIIVEGFASQTGNSGYLYNLNLSYLRSQRVLCALLNTTVPDALPEADRRDIQTLFLVGGSSFNTKQEIDPIKMQRVELKLEFLEKSKENTKAPETLLDPGIKCPNPI